LHVGLVGAVDRLRAALADAREVDADLDGRTVETGRLGQAVEQRLVGLDERTGPDNVLRRAQDGDVAEVGTQVKFCTDASTFGITLLLGVVVVSTGSRAASLGWTFSSALASYVRLAR
jgi:hypothetical protein